MNYWPIDFRIRAIEGITGIPNLSDVRPYIEEQKEVDAWIFFFDERFHLSRGDSNPLLFIKNIIGISEQTLEILGANSEGFYYNFSTEESLRAIFEKILYCSDDTMDSKNGFPSQYNISNTDKDKLLDIGGGNFIYPASLESLSNLNFLLDSVKFSLWRTRQNQNTKILYHATSWQNAIDILEEVQIVRRQNAQVTDFGRYSFYLGDTFQTAHDWALRKVQPAVLLFEIPDYFFESVIKTFNYDQEWKEFVLKMRNTPFRRQFNSRKEFNNAIQEYEHFVEENDNLFMIEGPILKNARAQTLDEAVCISYHKNRIIPRQYAFKEISLDMLNSPDVRVVAIFYEVSHNV